MRRAGWAVLATVVACALPAPAGHFVIARPTNLGIPRLEGLLPTVQVRLENVDGLFVLDTGANATIISKGFAARLSAKESGTDTGTDSGGQRLSVSFRSNVPLVLGDVSLTLAKVAVADIVPLEATGISGVISPHSLAGDGCTVMDFARGEGWVAPAGDPVCTRPATAFPLDTTAKHLPTITVTDGESGRNAVFIVDSGANRTALAEGFGASAPFIRSGHDQGIVGVVRDTQMVGPVCLHLGRHAVTLPEAVQFTPGRPAVLSFEVLKDARVVMRADGSGFLTVPRTEQGCPDKP